MTEDERRKMPDDKVASMMAHAVPGAVSPETGAPTELGHTVFSALFAAIANERDRCRAVLIEAAGKARAEVINAERRKVAARACGDHAEFQQHAIAGQVAAWTANIMSHAARLVALRPDHCRSCLDDKVVASSLVMSMRPGATMVPCPACSAPAAERSV